MAASVEGGSLYGTKNSNVIELTADNFAKEVFGSPHVWLVEFYAPWCGHCKRLTPEWEAAATKLKGLVKVAAVNCDDEKNKPLAGFFGIQGFPTIKTFGSKTEASPDGKGVVKKPQDYNGAREAAPLISHALSLLPSEHVLRLKDDAAFSAWKQQHPQGAPAILLFTDKPAPSSLAKALSIDFAHRSPFLQVASVATNACEEHGADKFPTIVALKGDGSSAAYSGKLEHAEIFKFLDQSLPAASSNSGSQQQQQQQQQQQHDPADEPAEIWQLTEQALFEQRCLSKKTGLCVVGFIDVFEEDSFLQHLDTFEHVGTNNLKKFRFMWADGPSNLEFASAFGVTSFPGLAVFSPSKRSFVPYFGAFEDKKIEDFLGNVLSGKKRTAPIDDIPPITTAAPRRPSAPKTEL